MPAGSVTFLTPWAALVGLAAVLPLAALTAIEYRAHGVSRLLGVAPSRPRSIAFRAGLILVACGLVGAAAAEPVWRTSATQVARTDAEAFFVLDVSRSMLAARRPTAPTRLEQAQAVAEHLRSAIGNVPAGVAGMTDRVLPFVFPTSDLGAFGATVRSSARIDAPPPANVNLVATTFDALGALGTSGFFARSATTRVCVVLTDGESGPFSPATAGSALAGRPGCRLLLIRVGSPADRIWRDDGRPEAAYRPRLTATADLARLAGATGARVLDASRTDAATRELAALVGTGPTAGRARVVHAYRLAPWLALISLVPLLALIGGELVTRPLQRETPMFYDSRLS